VQDIEAFQQEMTEAEADWQVATTFLAATSDTVPDR
jgi:hypothetical protein